MNIEKTLQDRKKTYGEYAELAELAQQFKRVAISSKKYTRMQSYQRESIDMIFSKLARILNGDNNNIDSWHDIVGYAKLVENELDKEKRINLNKNVDFFT